MNRRMLSSLFLFSTLLFCSLAHARSGERERPGDDDVGLVIMSLEVISDTGEKLPWMRVKGGSLMAFMDYNFYGPLVLRGPGDQIHLIWKGLPEGSYKGAAITLEPFGELHCGTGGVELLEDSTAVFLNGTCTVHVSKEGEHWVVSPLDLDPLAFEANEAGLERFRKRRFWSGWSRFIADHADQIEDYKVARREEIEAERAMTVAVNAQLRKAQAAREAALARLTFDDLVGIVGAIQDSPEVDELLQRGNLILRGEEVDRWEYDAFDVCRTYSIIGEVDIKKDIPGWRMGETEEQLVARLGKPFLRTRDGWRTSVYWKHDGWALGVILEGDEPRISTQVRLMDPSRERFLQDPINIREVADLPDNTLCSIVGRKRGDPAVAPLLQSMTSVPRDDDGDRSWIFSFDGVELRWDKNTQIHTVRISGPAGPLDTYRGRLPLGGSAYDTQDKLVKLYKASWAGNHYQGSTSTCTVGMTFSSDRRLQELWFNNRRRESGPKMSRDEWVEASNGIQFRCEDEIKALEAQMPELDESGPSVRSVGPATAVDTTNADGSTTRTYEQQGIEWGPAPDNSAALAERARLQAQIDEVKARCAKELGALGEKPQ